MVKMWPAKECSKDWQVARQRGGGEWGHQRKVFVFKEEVSRCNKHSKCITSLSAMFIHQMSTSKPQIKVHMTEQLLVL